MLDFELRLTGPVSLKLARFPPSARNGGRALNRAGHAA
jgi:hypothetical protein